ncbi:hypothetical protein PUNSTDRAFT_135148 [Punctularia strigosozonata HHB-11173 SS5]|uniref:uncharacterized protein n=1 Tax=Punctularia strigosozonata (strain HHB-11173) TaxID=741275 RepID=UPI00044164DD|nr:uncharacterized protein PUNSTDRAFT_135148 [Punctularia strigosozonata HHB-11173 SS5]EIN07628.1 hypothetical protein PUNSTDRAFT_135148 [Punctularia strigosozonata HHB-11173 SS5]
MTQNSLGLQLDKTESAPAVADPPAADVPSIEGAEANNDEGKENRDKSPTLQTDAPVKEQKEKKAPYVNPERVKTGGQQREKLSDEALAERMTRIREQNEKIKQRRMDVQADEDAFKKTQEKEAAKRQQAKKVQEDINRTREENARRKMNKMQSREWDSAKRSGNDFRPKTVPQPSLDAANDTARPEDSQAARTPTAETSVTRGSGRGRGRGGLRGKGKDRAASSGGASERDPAPHNDMATGASTPSVATVAATAT